MPDSPDQTPEPEHYSLEEMMERLKERGHEEGELVTRADGTVAIKVRKRKRRTKQPFKEEAKRAQRMRIIQIGTVFFLATIALGTLVGMLFYYNSNAFRESTLKKISDWTGAHAELAEFSVTPNSAKAASAQFSWPAGNYLRTLQLSSTSAGLDLSSFIGNKWGGTTVLSKSGKLVLGNVEKDAPISHSRPASDESFPFSFTSYRCEKLDILGLRDNQSPWLTIEGTEASLLKTTRGSQTRFTGGLMKLPGFQKMKVDRASIYFEGGSMRVETLRLKALEGTGTLELENSLELYSPARVEMQLKLENFPLDILMGQELDVIFSGFVHHSQNDLDRICSFSIGDADSYKVQLSFRGSERDSLTVRNLPFLRELSTELQNPEYARQFAFTDRVEGKLIRTAHSTKIHDLRMEKKGHFAIRGNMEVIDRILTGTLQVGLPTELLWNAEQHAALKLLFDRQEDGFLWCEIELSGQPSKPMDNFTELYQKALEKTAATSPKPAQKKQKLNIEEELEE